MPGPGLPSPIRRRSLNRGDSHARPHLPAIACVVSGKFVGGVVAAGLLTAAGGETIIADPEVPALDTLSVGGVLSAAIELAYALARRTSGAT